MIDFAINIEPLYPGMDICEKIKKVSENGFHAVEFWSWDDRDLNQIKKICRENQTKVRAFPLPNPGPYVTGNRKKNMWTGSGGLWTRQSSLTAIR